MRSLYLAGDVRTPALVLKVRACPKARFRKIDPSQGIIRRWDGGDGFHLPFRSAQICGIHGVLDDPPVRRRSAGDLEGCGAFRDGLADVARRIGSPTVVTESAASFEVTSAP